MRLAAGALLCLQQKAETWTARKKGLSIAHRHLAGADIKEMSTQSYSDVSQLTLGIVVGLAVREGSCGSGRPCCWQTCRAMGCIP